ncbi:YciI family protein [Nonomuraea dietziae]|uniref:YCII-related domain-containing protein n=1 Tax=Nonomuraea dietziae TaxID=65515 RepID=A0A7W5VKD7_9ACTN|nr:YciI family protein [Nonomuraea dietziae]MBB3733015.1 hypothetical protein [Nonomuraea dietziae]
MKYAMLIYGDDKLWEQATPEQAEQTRAAHERFIAMLSQRGAFLGGDALAGSRETVSLRKKDGHVLRTDGPYLETVEHLGGFYLIEAENLDEAIGYAKACPEQIVEVRPVVEYQE